MDKALFAGQALRVARTAIIGFGGVAQAQCSYLLSEESIGEGENSSILTVFPGIHDTLGDAWPPRLTDPLLIEAVDVALILFIDESISSIQLVPGRKGGGYIVETSQSSYSFRDVWLEPADVFSM